MIDARSGGGRGATQTRREFFRRTGRWSAGAALGSHLVGCASVGGSVDDPEVFDVVVIGGAPGGIAAAVTAARLGHSVVLVEYHPQVGGMSTSGLGKSDIENRAMIQGFFTEFIGRVRAHYAETYGEDSDDYRLCRDGYYFEPSVAQAVFDDLLAAEPSIRLLKFHRMESVLTREQRVVGVIVRDRAGGDVRTLTGKTVIDATYEGDVVAGAGARFRLGREPRDEFGEPHAGVVYFDYQEQRFLPETTGEGDGRLPAYTYRLCLATDPRNSVPITVPPPGYDRREYMLYFDDLRSGRMSAPKALKPGRGYNVAHFDTMVRALSVTPLPNAKTDVNMNPRPLAFPFVEENEGYVEGSWASREQICTRLRNLTLGLLWFIQNDSEVDPAHRELGKKYQLPRDEFVDNGHFPYQLYVREARRLVGEYTLTEHDVTRNPDRPEAGKFADGIAVGEFPIDSFPTRKRQLGDTIVLEGYLGMLDYITVPYQIPYRIMIPQTVDGLIVPVAASTTHVAYSSIRMEPTWMAMGQAAGVAAHVSLTQGVRLRDVPMIRVQCLLREQGQVLDLPT